MGSLADRMDPDDRTNWLSTNGSFGYLTLNPGADPAQLLAKLKPVLDRSVDVARFTNIRIPGSSILEPRLTPFLKVHMTSDSYRGTMAAAGDWTTLYGLIAIGIMILLVAGFNFMNLATARATVRAREISLRKCVGARRAQLVAQFLGEAVLMALFALAAAFALVEILLPSYSNFLDRPLTFRYFLDGWLTLTIIGMALLAGLLSGLYPALVLSGFRPIAGLRAGNPGRAGSGHVRSVLVLLQFAVSIGLGIAAITVFQQIDFVRQVDLGFRRDNIVVTSTGGRLSKEGVDTFIQTLEKGPGIVAVTQSSMTPFNYGNDVLPVQKPGDAQFLSPNHFSVGPNYFDFYGIEILAGRALTDKRADDVFHDPAEEGAAARNEGQNVMVNASLARALGYTPSDVVGRTFIFGKSHMTVVGVAADILFDGARTPAAQTVYVHAPGRRHALSIRVHPERQQEAMAYIERMSRTFIPNVALSRSFLNDRYERLFQGDTRQGQIFAVFVAIAILIACLGLFGLAALVAGRRTREIGIRKVFGARNRDVILLLLWQFSIPVLLANLIAWPLAWYYLQGWLQAFAHRIELSPLYFIGAGLAALLIAWATVFTHAWRVARANPVQALRTE
jgi:putative ABC transport system permease protein